MLFNYFVLFLITCGNGIFSNSNVKKNNTYKKQIKNTKSSNKYLSRQIDNFNWQLQSILKQYDIKNPLFNKEIIKQSSDIKNLIEKLKQVQENYNQDLEKRKDQSKNLLIKIFEKMRIMQELVNIQNSKNQVDVTNNICQNHSHFLYNIVCNSKVKVIFDEERKRLRRKKLGYEYKKDNTTDDDKLDASYNNQNHTTYNISKTQDHLIDSNNYLEEK